ncbi:MAG: formylglycine-generating enzyme family protein [Verrucomicrobiota bacterium]
MIIEGIEFALIPSGRFWMGAIAGDKYADDSERPRREVWFRDAFYLSVAPISEEQWLRIMGEGRATSLPKVMVNVSDAHRFCQSLRERTEREFRLPTEEEWEYACRADSEQLFSGSNEISLAQANYLYSEAGNRIGVGKRVPIRSYPANEFGLFDMHGNVSEWTSSSWKKSVATNELVIRGGAWDYLPRLLRCSCRDSLPESTRRDNVGFRIVMFDSR